MQIFCICVDAYRIYEGNDFDKIYEVLSTLKNKKFKLNNILIQNYNDLLETLDFEQHYYSRTALSICKVGHGSIRILK